MKKRIYIAMIVLLPLISVLLSGCETENKENSDISAVNSLEIVGEESIKEDKSVDDTSISDLKTEAVAIDQPESEMQNDILMEETEFVPEDVYEINITFDEEMHIQRTTWDFGEYGHELLYEIPVFPQNGIGYNKINGFFDTLLQEFIVYQENEYSGLTSILAQISEPRYNELYYDINSIDIFLESELCVGVKMRYDWYMGGVTDYGSSIYYFDTQSGEALTLLDFVTESEIEIKEMLVSELQDSTENSEDIYWDIVENYPIKEMSFQMYNGNLIVSFDKYEIAAGVMGGIGVTLPATFNETFGQELANMEDLT